jgi:hypothetical protein
MSKRVLDLDAIAKRASERRKTRQSAARVIIKGFADDYARQAIRAVKDMRMVTVAVKDDE